MNSHCVSKLDGRGRINRFVKLRTVEDFIEISYSNAYAF